MPKSTFFKLKEEKKKKIMDAALKEFSGSSFDTASINQIVKESDIAKGSFYQYFKDKDDIYNYVLEVCLSKKEEYLSRVLEENMYNDIYVTLKNIFLETVEFQRNNLRIFSILDKCGRSLDLRLKQDISMKKDYFNYLPIIELFEEEKRLENIDYDIDINTFIKILSRYSCVIMEDYIKSGSLLEVEKDIDEIISLLKNGIKPRKNFSRNRSIEDRFY